MAKILMCIATILLVQLVVANTAPAAAPQEDNVLLTLFTTVEGKVSEARGHIFNFMGVKDSNEAADKIVTDSKQYATKLSGLIDEIKEKAKSSTGELSESTTQFTNKLTEIVQKLEADTPQLKQYRETLESSLNTVVEATKDFSTQAGPINDEVKQLMTKVLSSTKDVAESVSTTVENAIKST